MIAPCDTDEEDANKDDEGPKEAGDHLKWTSELLNGKGGGVDSDAIHTNCDGHSQLSGHAYEVNTRFGSSVEATRMAIVRWGFPQLLKDQNRSWVLISLHYRFLTNSLGCCTVEVIPR